MAIEAGMMQGIQASTTRIQPGATLGILGGGQLERMLILAGRRMGYRFAVLAPSAGSAAGMLADHEVVADYLDEAAVRQFAEGVAVVTQAFENIPARTLEVAGEVAPVLPAAGVLHICQNRRREKEFLRREGFPCAPFAVVESESALQDALSSIMTPAVLKTADFGYDGKGQRKLSGEVGVGSIWREWKASSSGAAVLEGWVDFTAEYSVIVARSCNGEVRSFPVVENRHRDHILHLTLSPAPLKPALQEEARDLAESLAERIGVVGLLAVELFLTREGKWLVNELAPRPHNSGHVTFDASATSQFEQHLRAICGLPLGDPTPLVPAVMVNLLGDLWAQGEPDWSSVLQERKAKLHLYDKGEARPGRKMGHVTLLGEAGVAIVESFVGRAAEIEQKLRQQAWL